MTAEEEARLREIIREEIVDAHLAFSVLGLPNNCYDAHTTRRYRAEKLTRLEEWRDSAGSGIFTEYRFPLSNDVVMKDGKPLPIGVIRSLHDDGIVQGTDDSQKVSFVDQARGAQASQDGAQGKAGSGIHSSSPNHSASPPG